MFYNTETWIVTKQLQSRVKAFEMRCIRRKMRLNWQNEMSNEKVVQLMQQQLVLLRDMRLRQLMFFGHVMRERSVEHVFVTGRLLGQKARGRKRTKYLSQFPRNVIELYQTN